MKLKSLFHFSIDYSLILHKTIQVLFILLGAIVLYYVVKKIIERLFSVHVHHNELVLKRQRTIKKIVLSLWRYFLYFATFLIILSALGVNIQTILTGAGILGVVVAVGSQHLLQDFLEGFFNVFENNISDGDYISIDQVEGNIIDIGLRTIKVKSYSGEIHIVPNSKIGHIINYSLDNGKAIVDLLVDYEMNLGQVLDVMKETLKTIKDKNMNVLSEPIILGVNRLDPLGYEIRMMCDTIKESHWGVQRFIRSELLTAFKKQNLKISENQILIKRTS